MNIELKYYNLKFLYVYTLLVIIILYRNLNNKTVITIYLGVLKIKHLSLLKLIH